ncbi:MAG: hypothetical protein HYV62_01910 [Candidatus Rokubacteria bacterium]|nr:hypothetical protein [Candidatus Rokubacteria bacterium]
METHLPILPVVLPLAGALLVPIVALASRRALWPLAVGAGAATTVAAGAGLVAVAVRGTRRYAVGGWPPPWGIEVVLDPLSAFVAATVAGVSTLALLAAGPAVARGPRHAPPAFYALALVGVTGWLGMVVSGDLFNVFVFLEIASISGYALVASGGGPALAAAFRYVVLGTAGASFYLLGVGLLYALTGTLNMADLAVRLAGHRASPLFVGGVAFIAVGLGIKMGLFPLHGWLPDAYTHAPPAVSALLAPVATKAAAYALARVLLYVLRPAELPVGPVLAWAGAAAIVAGGVLALRQTDARRLLAYSSVSQMGYIALGLGVATPAALAGAYLHILNHALMKAALFLTLAAAAFHGRGPALARLGLGRGMPVTAACAVVAALSMVGVPPAAGFFSKWYLLQGAVEAGQPLLVASILVGSLLALAYMYRFTEAVWFGVPAPRDGPREAPRPVLFGLVVLAVLTLAAGLANAPLVGLLAPVLGVR